MPKPFKMNFYKGEIPVVVTYFESNSNDGLSAGAIEPCRKKYGSNTLKAANSRNILKILVSQFTSPLVIILIVAALFSYYLGNYVMALSYSQLLFQML